MPDSCVLSLPRSRKSGYENDAKRVNRPGGEFIIPEKLRGRLGLS
jgi:hypothetical protein